MTPYGRFRVAVWRINLSCIDDLAGRYKQNVAARRRDLAEVDDIRRRIPSVGRSADCARIEETVVGNVEGRCQEAATRRNHARSTDQHAIWVDEIHTARRVERAVDRGNIAAGHTVERRARAVVDRYGVPHADRKAVPIDDATPACLRDVQLPAVLSDAARAADKTAALRQRSCRHTRVTVKKRRDGNS
ncbi:hypothetical protein ABIE53_001109 [Burkholderia sp. OAS925]